MTPLLLWTSLLAAQETEPPDEPAPAWPAELVQEEATIGLDPADVVGAPSGTPLAGEELHQAAREVAVLLRCPTCQGMSVAESPAEGARAMRAEVERMMARGFSGEQTLDWFVASYGEFILLEPKKRGANLALWFGPGALVALGGIGIAAQVARHRRKGGEPAAEQKSAIETDNFRSQVEREVGK